MQDELAHTKQDLKNLLETLLSRGFLSAADLSRYAKPLEDRADPEFIRQELEQWYISLGLESILGRVFTLSPCSFTREEIAQAHEKQEMILCVPAGVTRVDLGKLFHIDSWALHDPLVLSSTEQEDFWFKTPMSLQPGSINRSGIEIKRLIEAEGKVHFSLERYLVFIGRVRSVLKKTPDESYWIWLTHKAYDRSGMLIAGFDRNGSFSVHGWMPQFSASFLGARSGSIAISFK